MIKPVYPAFRGDVVMSENRTYRNVFSEIGKTEEEISARLEEIVEEFFRSEDRVYESSLQRYFR